MFKLGDTVVWTSQAGGSHKTKTGVVVAVVPVGKTASECVPSGKALKDGRASPRKIESYLVQVGGRAMDLYWPVVSLLKAAEPEKLPDCCLAMVRGGPVIIQQVCPVCDHFVVTARATDNHVTVVHRWKLASTHKLDENRVEVTGA